MTEQEIINRLRSLSVFTGLGIMFFPQAIDVEKGEIKVLCVKNGCNWFETWDDLDCTKWAFERGDYKFIDGEDSILTKDGFEVTINIVDDAEPNKGGFYVEIEIADQRVDDFCIHPEDCDCSNPETVKNYAKNYIRNLELNWNGSWV